MNKSIIIVYAVIFLFVAGLKTGVDRYHAKLNGAEMTHSHTTEQMAQAPDATECESLALVSSQSEVVMKTLCLSCHSASESHDLQEKGFAPPMWGVRDHYLEHHEDLEAFTHAIAAWVQQPEEKKTLMRGAVKRFGVMPGLSLPKDQLVEIATLIYHGVNVEKPVWWDEHQRTHHGQPENGKSG